MHGLKAHPWHPVRNQTRGTQRRSAHRPNTRWPNTKVRSPNPPNSLLPNQRRANAYDAACPSANGSPSLPAWLRACFNPA